MLEPELEPQTESGLNHKYVYIYIYIIIFDIFITYLNNI